MFDRCLYFNLNRLARRVNRRWAAEFGALGLSPSHAYLVRLVLASPGITQAEAVRELDLEKSTVTRSVQKMMDAGLVRRAPVAASARLALYPTVRAEALQERLEGLGDALYAAMARRLGLARLTVLVRDLRDAAGKL